MTDEELIAYFTNRPLPTGTVQFSSYERTDDAQQMVALDIERIEANRQGADSARGALLRLKDHLEELVQQQAQPAEPVT